MTSTEILLLLLAVSAQFSDRSGLHFITVIEGEDAILSCGSVASPRCDMDWHFLEESRSTQILVGEQDDHQGQSALLKNCTLVLNNVTRDQAGYYSCTPTDDQQGAYTDTVLSVITVSKHREGAVLTLTCSVRTAHFYRPTLIWLIEGEEVPKDHRHLKISRSDSSVTVSFNEVNTTSEFHNSLSCQTTDEKPQEEKSAEYTWPIRDFFLRHVLMSVGLVILLVCAGTFHIWTRERKRNLHRMRLSQHHMDDNNSADIYEVIEDPSLSTQPSIIRHKRNF